MLIQRLIPSMFQRRLWLLLALIIAAFLAPAVQLTRLTLIAHDQHLADAEARLVRSVQTPTVRGSIVDRKGRVLAQDRPSYDIAVKYQVITGEWATTKAREAARRAMGPAWSAMTAEARRAEVEKRTPAFLIHLDEGWNRLAQAAGVSRAALDAKRDEVITKVSRRQQAVTQARLRQETADAEARGLPLSEADRRAMERRAQSPIAEMEQAHALIARVGDEIGFACLLLAGEVTVVDPGADPLAAERFAAEVMPGLAVHDSGQREYPCEWMNVRLDRSSFPSVIASEEPADLLVSGVATHVLGGLRDTIHATQRRTLPDGTTVLTPGDADRRAAYLEVSSHARALATEGLGLDRGSYRDGDRVGSSGIERSQENLLRGLRGLQTSHLDTGERRSVPPVKGRDVVLTLDIALQARVQALMSPEAGLAVVQPWHKLNTPAGLPPKPIGTPLNGAAVVLDADTGDILAMVSTPTYTRQDIRERLPEMLRDELNAPLVNRAVGKYYTPGSIVKPIVLSEAVVRGAFTIGQTIDCTGHLFENQPGAFRCWIYKNFQTTHTAFFGHELSAEEALGVSCNIFFFTLARRLGTEGVIAAYEDFHVGRSFDLGVGGEAPGMLGYSRTKARYGLETGDAIQMGIGQGPVTWTPLHAANAYATLARGGLMVPPRIVAGAERDEPRDLHLDPRAVAAALEGLRRSVEERSGTGHHIMVPTPAGGEVQEVIFNAPGLRVWGKTGTADAPAILGPDPDGPAGPMPRTVIEDGDHSWFVAMAGADRPRFVVAVVIDYGGSGGKVSGPICNQILHALLAEGYLP